MTDQISPARFKMLGLHLKRLSDIEIQRLRQIIEAEYNRRLKKEQHDAVLMP